MVFSLYDITNEIAAIITATPEDGELTPQLEQWFEQLGEMEAKKLDEYYEGIDVLLGQAKQAEEQVALYQRKANQKIAKVAAMKDRLKKHFETTGRTLVTTERGRDIRLQKNGGVQKLEIEDIKTLPLNLTKVVSETVADTALIRSMLEKGVEIPGAKLLPRGTSIRFS